MRVKPFLANLTFTSSLKAFTAALAPLARATAPAKSMHPICANVLLSVLDGQLTLVTTNLEMTIVETMDVQVQTALLAGDSETGAASAGPMEVTLPYRLLADLLGTISGDSVTVAFSEDRAVIQCGGSNSEIMGIPAREFPGVERTAKDLPFCFTAGDFKQAARQVEFAASTDESRPVLKGVLLTPAYDSKKEVVGMTLAATDGFRVAVKTIGFSEPSIFSGKSSPFDHCSTFFVLSPIDLGCTKSSFSFIAHLLGNQKIISKLCFGRG